MSIENPPAFPRTGEGVEPGVGHGRYDCPGMTLRDYFAGQALTGICANPNFFGSIFQQSPEAAADFAGKAADAMLTARQKGTADENAA